MLSSSVLNFAGPVFDIVKDASNPPGFSDPANEELRQRHRILRKNARSYGVLRWAIFPPPRRFA
jgi:hypothetical protein